MESSKNELSLDEVIQLWTAAPGIRKIYLRTLLKKSWEELMGPQITGMTRKMTLIKGVLHVTVDSAPLKSELNINREKIKNMINERLGEVLIQDVKIQ